MRPVFPAKGGKHGVLYTSIQRPHTPREVLPSIQQTSTLIITLVAITMSLVGRAVVVHGGTHECDDRAALDVIVNIGSTKITLEKRTPRNGNRTQTQMATVTKDKKV